MIENATDAMRVILDHPESAEAQNAIQRLLTLAVERQDPVAFQYLGTLLRQMLYPALTAYTRPFFLQAINRIENNAVTLESALSSHRQMIYQTEKEFQQLQALERLQSLRQSDQVSGDASQQTATSLQQSLMLLREQLNAHLKKVEADYPEIFAEPME